MVYDDHEKIDEMRTAALNKVRDKADDRPILVFMCKEDDAFVDGLKKAARTIGGELQRINSFDDAQSARERVTGDSRGITILHRSLCRGFDYKLGMDAYVIVYGNDLTMSYWFANQACGRGCRAMGSPRATVYVLCEGIRSGGGKSILMSRVVNDRFAGGEIVRRVFNVIDGLVERHAGVLAAWYFNENWLDESNKQISLDYDIVTALVEEETRLGPANEIARLFGATIIL